MSLSLTAGQLGRDKSPAAAGEGRVTRRAGPKREALCGSNVSRALVNVGVSCGWTARWKILCRFVLTAPGLARCRTGGSRLSPARDQLGGEAQDIMTGGLGSGVCLVARSENEGNGGGQDPAPPEESSLGRAIPGHAMKTVVNRDFSGKGERSSGRKISDKSSAGWEVMPPPVAGK